MARPMPLVAHPAPRDRSNGTPDLFRRVRREQNDVEREKRSLAGQIRDLESFIAAAPAAIERHRLRFKDTLPPPDDVTDSGRGEARRQLSRREIYERSLRRTRGLLLLAGLAIAAGGILLAIYLLASPGR